MSRTFIPRTFACAVGWVHWNGQQLERPFLSDSSVEEPCSCWKQLMLTAALRIRGGADRMHPASMLQKPFLIHRDQTKVQTKSNDSKCHRRRCWSSWGASG